MYQRRWRSWPGWGAGASATATRGEAVMGSPAMDGAVESARDRQVRALVGVFRGQVLVDVHTQPGRFAGLHEAGLERIGVREDGVGLRGVWHQLLDPEVVDGDVEVQGGRHADG